MIDEDFVNYLKPSMYIGFPTCTFKCDTDCGRRVCQNRPLATSKKIEISYDEIVERYLKNEITSSIIFAGLEPLDSISDTIGLISEFRKKTNDDIVVYTGYFTGEPQFDKFAEFVDKSGYKNILVKMGRYVPDEPYHYDKLIGVTLASIKQYGKKLS